MIYFTKTKEPKTKDLNEYQATNPFHFLFRQFSSTIITRQNASRFNKRNETIKEARAPSHNIYIQNFTRICLRMHEQHHI